MFLKFFRFCYFHRRLPIAYFLLGWLEEEKRSVSKVGVNYFRQFFGGLKKYFTTRKVGDEGKNNSSLGEGRQCWRNLKNWSSPNFRDHNLPTKGCSSQWDKHLETTKKYFSPALHFLREKNKFFAASQSHGLIYRFLEQKYFTPFTPPPSTSAPNLVCITGNTTQCLWNQVNKKFLFIFFPSANKMELQQKIVCWLFIKKRNETHRPRVMAWRKIKQRGIFQGTTEVGLGWNFSKLLPDATWSSSIPSTKADSKWFILTNDKNFKFKKKKSVQKFGDCQVTDFFVDSGMSIACVDPEKGCDGCDGSSENFNKIICKYGMVCDRLLIADKSIF